MDIPKKYLHDKFVLLLVSISVFLAFLCITLILLRSGIGQGVNGYIVSYRSNLGLSGYQRDGIIPIFSFIVFAILSLAINILLSIRTYPLRRSLSLTILAMGIFLLTLATIVSNSLLTLY